MSHDDLPKTLIREGLDSIVLQYGDSGPDTRIDVKGSAYLTGIKYLAKERPPIPDGPILHHSQPDIEAVILTIRIEPNEDTGVAFTAESIPRVDVIPAGEPWDGLVHANLDGDGRLSIHPGKRPTNGMSGVSQS